MKQPSPVHPCRSPRLRLPELALMLGRDNIVPEWMPQDLLIRNLHRARFGVCLLPSCPVWAGPSRANLDSGYRFIAQQSSGVLKPSWHGGRNGWHLLPGWVKAIAVSGCPDCSVFVKHSVPTLGQAGYSQALSLSGLNCPIYHLVGVKLAEGAIGALSQGDNRLTSWCCHEEDTGPGADSWSPFISVPL